MDQPAGLAGTSAADLPWDFAAAEIVAVGRRLDRHGWVPATAGNLSRRLLDGRIAITRSGVHKGFLSAGDVIEVDLDGRALNPLHRPSAETLLHCQIYRDLPEGAVLHGHSVAATVLSLHARTPELVLSPELLFSGYELLKVFDGATHDTTLRLPVFDNDQDIARLSRDVAPHLAECPMGYLLRGHGVYVWGRDMEQALARLEGLEFLLACALERCKLEPNR